MKSIRNEVAAFMAERNWDKQPPADVAKSIVIEGAELLEHFQWSSFFAEDIENKPEIRQDIIDELADVFIYALQMSILLNCDVDTIIRSKLARAAKKYPVKLVKGKASVESYRKIKSQHRRKTGK